MEFLSQYWPHIIIIVGVVSALCMALGKWMLENDVAWDDKAGTFLKWMGGLFNSILAIVGGIKGGKK